MICTRRNPCIHKSSHAVRQLRTQDRTMGYATCYCTGLNLKVSLRKSWNRSRTFEMLEMVLTLISCPKRCGIMLDYVKTNWNFECPRWWHIVKDNIALLSEEDWRGGFDALHCSTLTAWKNCSDSPLHTFCCLIISWCPDLSRKRYLGSGHHLISPDITERQPRIFGVLWKFFEKSMLVGVFRFHGRRRTADRYVLPWHWPLDYQNSLLNVLSKVKTGEVTCSSLKYRFGAYLMLSLHRSWPQTPPAMGRVWLGRSVPRCQALRSSRIVARIEFSQLVSSQHVIVSYKDVLKSISDFCYITDVKLL
jgi:hypothetical protein